METFMTRRIFQNLALILTPLSYAGGVVAIALKFLSPLPPPRRALTFPGIYQQ